MAVSRRFFIVIASVCFVFFLGMYGLSLHATFHGNILHSIPKGSSGAVSANRLFSAPDNIKYSRLTTNILISSPDDLHQRPSSISANNLTPRTPNTFVRTSTISANNLTPVPDSLHARSFGVNSENFTPAPDSLHRQEVFEKIFATNFWQGRSSRSGPGSELDYTLAARNLLAEIVVKYNIKTLLDAPCGDFNWIHQMSSFASLNYVGVDIVRSEIQQNRDKAHTLKLNNARFDVLDIVNDPLTTAYDLIITRHALMHLSFADGLKALRNIVASGSRFLLTTTYRSPANRNINAGEHYHINLHLPPFNFNASLMGTKEPGGDGFDMYIELFELPLLSL